MSCQIFRSRPTTSMRDTSQKIRHAGWIILNMQKFSDLFCVTGCCLAIAVLHVRPVPCMTPGAGPIDLKDGGMSSKCVRTVVRCPVHFNIDPSSVINKPAMD